MTTADARLPAVTGAGNPRHRWTGRLPSALLPIRGGQVVAWEAAAIAIALSWHSAALHTTVIALACLVFLATSVRFAGRHLANWSLVWVSFRLLQHDDRREVRDPLLALAPDLRLRQHHDRAGNRFGVVGIGDGWSAVIRLDAAGSTDVPILVETLRQACDNADIPLAGAQVLVRADGDAREYLLAVRYRPAEAPIAAVARGNGELGELRATARAALGVLGSLVDLGYSGTVLEAGELAAELRKTLGVHEDRPGSVLDGWRSWATEGSVQAGFVPVGEKDPAAVLGTYARGSAFTVTSYSLRRNSLGRLRQELTIRVVKNRRRPRSRELPLRVVPLYGLHERAVRRSLPLALAR
ncbi:type VII secretion protein EccE [Amycolatopsis acidicola]|uniref:type VII secretion protein EccE n=1 Tax=Amycolatopsis acidicola TaxID=2596893 RepID=UPI001FB7EB73|nr:type VII secretion protein EccE [Amycolatopsis acidicola]